MSFNLAAPSPEIHRAIQYANTLGIVCVAAAGNQGVEEQVYPAAYTDLVMGIASTSNTDQLSSFSNYGAELVWAAAPGEGVMTTYPFGLWAAAWGTSFSTPMISGTAALLLQMSPFCDQYCASSAIAHAVPLGDALGNGRLDVYQALQAEATALGMR
jgi:subtilisin family serine protease